MRDGEKKEEGSKNEDEIQGRGKDDKDGSEANMVNVGREGERRKEKRV